VNYLKLIFLTFIVSSSATIYAQQNGVSTSINLSYSGLSQSVRYSRHGEKLSFYLGPKFSYSKNRDATSQPPGISFQADFHPDCKGKYFLLYEYLPQKVRGGNSNIHEVYVGYGYRWDLGEFWQINSGIGMGFYYESGSSIVPYSIQGLAYCSNVGIAYRF
jgi:hypothetical protein